MLDTTILQISYLMASLHYCRLWLASESTKNQRWEAPQLIDVFSEIKIPVVTASPRLSLSATPANHGDSISPPFSTSEPLYHVNSINLKPQVDKHSGDVTMKKIVWIILSSLDFFVCYVDPTRGPDWNPEMAALLFSDSGFSNFIRDLAFGHGVVMEDTFDF
jgi:hypothetical protein